jgi:hypothetical protein
MLLLAAVTWTLLACSGHLEYELGAYQVGASGTPPPVETAPPREVPPPPATTPPATTPPATTPPLTMTPPATMTPPLTMTPPPIMNPPPAMTPPPASACPQGVDALGLLAEKCGQCHGDKDKAKGLDLVTPGLAVRVVGVKSTCNDKLLLDGSGPTAAGHLLDKLRGPVAGCGAQMPYGMPALTTQERDCITEWADQAIARTKEGK